MDKKINFSIDEGPDFFAHEVTVNFNPTQFILDFKCLTPRSDARNQSGPTISVKHNVVMIDAYHAKRFHELLGTVIQRYEKDFGEIEKPKAVFAAEKKKTDLEGRKSKATVPSYFG